MTNYAAMRLMDKDELDDLKKSVDHIRIHCEAFQARMHSSKFTAEDAKQFYEDVKKDNDLAAAIVDRMIKMFEPTDWIHGLMPTAPYKAAEMSDICPRCGSEWYHYEHHDHCPICGFKPAKTEDSGETKTYKLTIDDLPKHSCSLSAPEVSETDMIHHPDHYTWKGTECKKVIEIMTQGLSGVEAYYMGNIIKYLYRYPKKGTLKSDLMKAEEYTKFLRELFTR